MPSLADIPELVGFFSYSREDDEDSQGALSALRERIQRELRGQLGRSTKTFRLWQDKEAIASGKLWEAEIKTAVGQSVFFIPIITPTVVRSPNCRFELEAFLAREAELGRNDLVFPILYIKVPELEDTARRKNDPVLSIIAKRQYLDWRELRHRDIHSANVKEAVERFCAQICDALCQSWLSPEERKQQEAAARRQAEAERQRRAAEAKRREKEEAQRRREVEAAREAEAERKRAEEQRVRDEAEEKRPAKEEGGFPPAPPQPGPPLWQKTGPALLIGSLAGVVLIGAIGLWLAAPPTPVPVPPTSSTARVTTTPTTPVAPSPAPVTPTPTAPVAPSSGPTAPVTPSPAPVAPKAQSGSAVGERAVLSEEDPGNAQGKQYVGSAVWRGETVLREGGLRPQLQIRADFKIPQRNMTVTWSLYHNTDQSLPASLIIEIKFNPPDFPDGGIANILGVLMKESEQARGVPLAGLVVKVADGYFLFRLSAADADVQRNLQLLKDRPWFEVPIIYNNGGRAILALEKGPSGDRAFALWGGISNRK